MTSLNIESNASLAGQGDRVLVEFPTNDRRMLRGRTGSDYRGSRHQSQKGINLVRGLLFRRRSGYPICAEYELEAKKDQHLVSSGKCCTERIAYGLMI